MLAKTPKRARPRANKKAATKIRDARLPSIVENDEHFRDAAVLARAHKKAEDSGPVVMANPRAAFARLLDSLTSDERKQYPMASGLHDYFPDALATVSHISYLGNQKHNPGEPLHWARGKSMDHADCCQRHLDQRGSFDSEHVRHSAQLAWRALALLQEELENEFGYELPRGATDPEELPRR